jgi:hypothetical protein
MGAAAQGEEGGLVGRGMDSRRGARPATWAGDADTAWRRAAGRRARAGGGLRVVVVCRGGALSLSRSSPPPLAPFPLSLSPSRSHTRPAAPDPPLDRRTYTRARHGRTRPRRRRQRRRRRRAPAARPRLRLRPRGRTARRRPRRRPQRVPGGVQAARLRVVELLPRAGPADGDEARQVRRQAADSPDEPLSEGRR